MRPRNLELEQEMNLHHALRADPGPPPALTDMPTMTDTTEVDAHIAAEIARMRELADEVQSLIDAFHRPSN